MGPEAQAIELDRKNGNTKWADSEKAEKDQLQDYKTFDDRGHRFTATTPKGSGGSQELHREHDVNV